ncbi:ribosomal protein L1p/L10e family-domain-containing protein [Talaromyces proteolyticus]|uniref:Ribosomal protein L1p/L10e family-domain-containing protein n=1 Tax=Talaromyces proteolyticus TaxID=1131652 RepID=A0AAD4L796_9EURO|nr:ribosomal protein L1p/L10e family-domain-containing protein [Talaromyces proteolyticus]KAH8705890.1 ribosomal protein L1p/L10e family-domain-containing protein [Talaromyces proteolyticus]
MVSATGPLTTKVASGTPYQLDNNQVQRASTALLKYMKSQQKELEETSTKKTLIGDNDDSSDEEDVPSVNEPVWLVMTTKKHVVDKNRLKPGKISIPHSLNSSPSLNICIITADPQRAFKDIVADPSFPSTLSSRITKVIGFTKLKQRYKSFESRRQLLSEHDVFLADDRIITRLAVTLGKTFYKSSKRPIPIRIEQVDKVDGKRVKKDTKKSSKDESNATFASPLVVAKEIEKALNSASVHLAPAATTALRIGTSSFTPDQLTENVKVVVDGLTGKFITKGWRNVKAIHIKGPTTMAMPIWLASELWVDETDVLENVEKDTNQIESEKGEKRKITAEEDVQQKTTKKSKKSKAPVDEDDTARNEKLRKQKAKALDDGTTSPSAKRK